MEREWPYAVPPSLHKYWLVTFTVHLRKKVCSTDDNPDNILNIMNKYGFHKLPEDAKLYLLHYHRNWPKGVLIRYPFYEWSIWDEILSRDKINTMMVLLPHAQLFAIDRSKIPCEYLKWISSFKQKRNVWIRDTLLKLKLRWKSNTCRCTNHDIPTDEVEIWCSLTKIAFTSFAAELCCHNVAFSPAFVRCTAYLLCLAPDLINVQVPRVLNNTVITWGIAHSGENFIDILLMSNANRSSENIGKNLVMIFNHVCNPTLTSVFQSMKY